MDRKFYQFVYYTFLLYLLIRYIFYNHNLIMFVTTWKWLILKMKSVIKCSSMFFNANGRYIKRLRNFKLRRKLEIMAFKLGSANCTANNRNGVASYELLHYTSQLQREIGKISRSQRLLFEGFSCCIQLFCLIDGCSKQADR